MKFHVIHLREKAVELGWRAGRTEIAGEKWRGGGGGIPGENNVHESREARKIVRWSWGSRETELARKVSGRK